MNPYYSSDGIIIFNAKAHEVVPRLGEQFGVLVFDPPFTFNDENLRESLKLFDDCLFDSAALIVLPLLNMSIHNAFGHPHVRPLANVIEVLKETSGPILDPYMGSGTTLVAAKRLGRPACGIEMDPKYCQAAVERLNAVERLPYS